MKEIALTQGKVALVDDEDYDSVNQYKWHARKAKRTYYAKRKNYEEMHRFIINVCKVKSFLIIPFK